MENYYLQETQCLYYLLVVIESPSSHFTVRKELINLSQMKQGWREEAIYELSNESELLQPRSKRVGRAAQ